MLYLVVWGIKSPVTLSPYSTKKRYISAHNYICIFYCQHFPLICPQDRTHIYGVRWLVRLWRCRIEVQMNVDNKICIVKLWVWNFTFYKVAFYNRFHFIRFEFLDYMVRIYKLWFKLIDKQCNFHHMKSNKSESHGQTKFTLFIMLWTVVLIFDPINMSLHKLKRNEICICICYYSWFVIAELWELQS